MCDGAKVKLNHAIDFGVWLRGLVGVSDEQSVACQPSLNISFNSNDPIEARQC